jgi:hypothetical protein
MPKNRVRFHQGRIMSAICLSTIRWSAIGSVSSDQFHRLNGIARCAAFTNVAGLGTDPRRFPPTQRGCHATVATGIPSCRRSVAMKPIAVAAVSLQAPKHSVARFDQIEIKPVAVVQN